MRTYDLSPLFRSTIGFDRLFDLAEAAQRVGEESYPPYNIERLDENNFQISVALAGFKPDEVELTVEQNVLTVSGVNAGLDKQCARRRGLRSGLVMKDRTLLVSRHRLESHLQHVTLEGRYHRCGAYHPVAQGRNAAIGR